MHSLDINKLERVVEKYRLFSIKDRVETILDSEEWEVANNEEKIYIVMILLKELNYYEL